MSNFIVRFIDGSKLKISEKDFKNLDGKTGLVFISSIGETINMLSISRIYPEENEPETNDHKVGVLHDGTRVIRQFGEWFCMGGERDEKGMYAVRPDIHYYPEVARDCVPSVETFDRKYLGLPAEERKALMCSGRDGDRFLRDGHFEKIGQLVEGREKEISAPAPNMCRHGILKIDCSCYDQELADKDEVTE